MQAVGSTVSLPQRTTGPLTETGGCWGGAASWCKNCLSRKGDSDSQRGELWAIPGDATNVTCTSLCILRLPL